MGQLFISYSRQDRDFVDGLIRDLEETGLDVWVDREDIRGGSQWRAAITQAIRDCDAFMVVLSPNSAGSKNVGRELELAADNHRPIMPILYQPCDIPAEFEYHFAGVQRIDFSDSSSGESPLDRLIDALKGVSGGDAKNRKKDVSSQPSRARPRPPQTRPPRHQPSQPPQQEQGQHEHEPLPAWGSAPQPAPPPSLPQLLVGRWNVQITHPFTGASGNLELELAPAGMFQGRLMNPMGMTQIQGQWQVTPMNQVVLQGQETNGFQVMPYGTVVQINQVAPNQLAGQTMAGEQVLWRKVM